ncbi:hypothetical protein [Bacillus chungangensis]|uniref:Peptidase n=1 Tax=Bacillus chungangensis TaxID=587633 RepID=A0ABT9WYA3_9BACI|nr:hypothetical protein [Bacillus chungangensis]MDQ0178271.1 hypothetical protein [Bacillus chungangensis]
MKTNKLKRSGFKKAALAGLVMIGSGTLLSPEFTHAASAGAIKQTTPITTSYANHTTNSSKAAQTDKLSDYKKANYTVKLFELDDSDDSAVSYKPTSKDMAKEAAAEIGAKALWELFGQSLEGKVIEMSYFNASLESHPELFWQSRPEWTGTVQINDKLNYSFTVDAVTGEMFRISHNRQFDDSHPIVQQYKDNKGASDLLDKIAENPQEYVEPAKKLAEKYNVIQSPIKSVEFKGTGSRGKQESYNDPYVRIEITGKNGERADVELAMRDKELVGITYPGLWKQIEEDKKNRK